MLGESTDVSNTLVVLYMCEAYPASETEQISFQNYVFDIIKNTARSEGLKNDVIASLMSGEVLNNYVLTISVLKLCISDQMNICRA